MTATLNSDCSILTLNLPSLVLADGKTFNSLTLKSRSNCSLTETSLDVSILIASIADNQILVPSTLFYTDETKTTYCDGVFYFKLEVNYTIEDVVYLAEDSACMTSVCQLRCKVNDYYFTTKDKKAHYLYYALLLGNDCDSCYCTKMCSYYTDLKLLLNDNSASSTDSGCGCS